MPLELGLSLGAKRFGNDDQEKKRCLIMDVAQYRFQQFISDLAGIYISAHNGDPRRIVQQVQDWLVTASKRKTLPSPAMVVDSYDRFTAALPAVALNGGLNADELIFADLERLMLAWIQTDDRQPVPA